MPYYYVTPNIMFVVINITATVEFMKMKKKYSEGKI